MTISKTTVIAVLRERGQHSRADFVDRNMPDRIDPDRHSGLLSTLHLDPSDLTDPDPA